MPADPAQPVPGPTREQIADEVGDVLWHAGVDDDNGTADRIADAVMALLPARPSPTDDDLSELRRLNDAATPGPWRTHDTWLDLGGYTEVVIRSDKTVPWSVAWLPTRSGIPLDDQYGCMADSHLIAAMRNALPGLLAEIERLRA